ncbi:MAG: PKD domain-containing protein [Chitinophagaceae bacterium]
MKNFTYLCRNSLYVLCVLALTSISSVAQQVPKGLTASSNGIYIGFYEYKPVDYSLNPSEKYPLIVFLHGIGERGDGVIELPNVLGQGIPKYINSGHPMRFFWNGKWETFLVLSPQLSRNYGDWQNFYVDEMLAYAKQNLRIDTNRIYLTGLSLGGGGVWKYASASLTNAKKFAAIAPVCGTCAISNACNLANANLPVWAFHAQDDGVVGAGCTTSSIQGINNCNPAVKPLMTIYSNGGHFIWDRSFDTVYNWHNPNLYEWFLGQNKSLPINVGPIANAGPNVTITIPTTSAMLNATGSTDPDGTITRYLWKKISGPNAGIIQTPNNATTNIVGLVETGVYTYELMVADNRAAFRLDTVQITVNSGPPGTNIPPFAMAGYDVTITVNQVNLDSWGSRDVDGAIVGYLWSKISGPSTFAIPYNMYASCGITGMVSGVYQFELQVTDNMGGIGKDTVQVTVNLPGPPPVNQAPTANAGNDIIINLPANSTTLNGAASYDPDGSIATYAWSKITGPPQFLINIPGNVSSSVTNLVAGVYSFRLLITDNNGAVDSDTVLVTVNAAPPPSNIAPVAFAGTDVSITLPVNSVSLNGSGSYDSDGSINAYNWSKLSGPTQYTIANASLASTSINNLVAGTYSFRLVVTDNIGATGSDTLSIIVLAAPPPPNILPIAKAGADISIMLPANSSTLNGFDSYDPDGIITNFAWSKISGPTQYTIGNPNNGSTTISGLVQGVYLFRLLVTDNSGTSSPDTVVVTVSTAPPPPNQSPVANAGADKIIILPSNSVNVSGTSSYDPDGSIVTYNWVKISGPAQFTIVSASAVTSDISNLIQGNYNFRLVVTDNNGAVDSDTLSIQVQAPPPPPNQGPSANAGSDIIITLPSNSITLNGTASSDPDGNITSYLWTKIGGPNSFNISNSTNQITTVTNLVQGTYSFLLVITDNAGATDRDTIIATVNAALPPPNQAPVANAGNDISITLPVNSTILSGGASIDSDGTISTYNWSKTSGPTQYTIVNGTSISASISNLVQGTYSFQLEVTDNLGATSTDVVLVTVQSAVPPPNQAPIANAGNDVSITLPSNNTTLSGGASIDPDGIIATYNWSKISGPAQYTITNGGTVSPLISNLVQGTYSFQLEVTDNLGALATDIVVIVVQPAIPPPNQAPIANAGADFSVSLPNPSIYLNGSDSRDPDGSITGYSWVKISGPGAITIINSTTALPSVFGVQSGEYVFELTVTDDKGINAKDQVIVTVNAAVIGNNKPVAKAGNDIVISIPASSVTLDGTSSADTDGTITGYSWKQIAGSGITSLSNAKNVVTVAYGLVAGEYQFELTVTDNSGSIGKDTVSITVVNNLRYLEKLSLYPNPVMSIMTVSCISDSVGQSKLTIYDQNGILLQTIMFVKNQAIQEQQVNVSRLKAGIYFLEVMISDKKKMIARFIKQ